MFKIKTQEGNIFPSIKESAILDSALSAGLVFDYSCKNGQCGSCKTTLLKGKVVEIRPQLALHKTDGEDQFLSCCCEAASDILIDAIDLKMMHGIETKIIPARVNSLTLLSEDIVQVKLRLPPASNFNFLEGQFVDVIGPNSLRRSYSIASIPSNKEVILLIKKVKDGEFSNYWFSEAKLNDLLRIEGPKGTFFLRNKSKSLVFLATGTGIAPIISILEELDADINFIQTRSISLFWGNREQKDFIWTPRFESITVDLNLILSREDACWESEVGYVQDVALRKLNEVQSVNVYACGASEMIDSAKKSFIEAGLNERDFYSDAFVQSF